MGEWTYICLIFVAMFQFCCSRICLIICWLTRPVWTVVTGNGRPRYRVSTEARPCYLPGLAGHQVRSVVLFGLTHKLPRYTKDSEIYLCIESNTKLSMQASLLNIYREQPLWLMLTYHLVCPEVPILVLTKRLVTSESHIAQLGASGTSFTLLCQLL